NPHGVGPTPSPLSFQIRKTQRLRCQILTPSFSVQKDFRSPARVFSPTLQWAYPIRLLCKPPADCHLTSGAMVSIPAAHFSRSRRGSPFQPAAYSPEHRFNTPRQMYTTTLM